MSTVALSQLATALNAPPPDSVAQLPEPQLQLLADAFRDEHARRAEGLGRAAEEALKLVPALARGPVRRILFR
ncbi:hypothetical protein [Streptomyces sp. NBC_01465]|uniref:hypothetical protein n=1 Tax=Streptomyces sp. NBC_01465 TaxID=2903878 RepID=UPI002E379E6A|nr:hypothetical protein [Streptomyces sp. NBC_01465]